MEVGGGGLVLVVGGGNNSNLSIVWTFSTKYFRSDRLGDCYRPTHHALTSREWSNIAPLIVTDEGVWMWEGGRGEGGREGGGEGGCSPPSLTHELLAHTLIRGAPSRTILISRPSTTSASMLQTCPPQESRHASLSQLFHFGTTNISSPSHWSDAS